MKTLFLLNLILLFNFFVESTNTQYFKAGVESNIKDINKYIELITKELQLLVDNNDITEEEKKAYIRHLHLAIASYMQQRDQRPLSKAEQVERDRKLKFKKEYAELMSGRKIETEKPLFKPYINLHEDASGSNLTKEKIKGFSGIVGGAPEEIRDMLDIIKGSDIDYTRYGITAPKGFIFVGPPGTGKTALARAIAEEAGFAFIDTSATDFSFKYIGQAAKAIRQAFEEAKKAAITNPYGKSILFIDEIDHIASNRSSEDSSSKSEALFELLNQLDGFKQDNSVIVIGATNHPDRLDKAIKRAGRLETTIKIDLPDKDKRVALLQFYSKDMPISECINFEKIAEDISGSSAADAKHIVCMAAMFAAKGKAPLSQNHLEAAVAKWKQMEADKNASSKGRRL